MGESGNQTTCGSAVSTHTSQSTLSAVPAPSQQSDPFDMHHDRGMERIEIKMGVAAPLAPFRDY